MSAPSFRCAPASEGGLLFQYRSHRRGFNSFVIGLVKAIAREIFKLDVHMEAVPLESSSCTESDDVMGGNSSVQAFIIRDKKALSLGSRKRSTSFISNFSKLRISSNPKDLSLTQETFCHAFPFHFVLNRSLEIVQLGKHLARLAAVTRRATGDADTLKLSDMFVIQKPLVAMTFSSILSNTNTSFTLRLRAPAAADARRCGHGRAATAAAEVKTDEVSTLRGQVIYMPESDSILFMCSPRLHEIAHLRQMHLKLTDIPRYDVTRQLFLVSQCRRQGRELVQKLEETTCSLLTMQEKLQRERRQTDKLLFSMLPEHIAHELRLHRRIKAEKFDVVTVLCSDIVNFTALCSHENVVPMDIIRVLNKLYTQFDALTSIHGVFKVRVFVFPVTLCLYSLMKARLV